MGLSFPMSAFTRITKKKKKKNEAKLGEKRNTLLEFQNNKDSSLIPVEVLLEPYRSS